MITRRVGWAGGDHENTLFICWLTLIKVVLLLSSFNLPAPTYVHVDRNPPRMSCMVALTSPLYSTSTALPSDAL